MTFWDRVLLEDERIESIIINPQGEEVLKIGSNGDKQIEMGVKALFTATDYFIDKKYEGEWGLHLYTNIDEELLTQRVGYVASHYAGKEYPKPDQGWICLYKTGETYHLEDFEDHEHKRNVLLKHTLIDYFMKGTRIEVRMLHKQEFAKSSIMIWEGKKKRSIEDARKKGQQALAHKLAADRATGRKQRRKAEYNGLVFTPPKRVQEAGTIMAVKDDAPIDLFSLEPGNYPVCNRAGKEQSVEYWDPNNSLIVNQWKNMILYGWQIKLPANV